MELKAPDSSTSGRHTAGRNAMRRSLVGALVVAGLVLAAMAGRGSTEPPMVQRGESVPHPPQNSELITHMSAPQGQPQTLTVIDPRQRVIAVYHVDGASGEIA